MTSGDSFLVSQRGKQVALAAQHDVPALYHRRGCTAIGGLMSYGPSLAEDIITKLATAPAASSMTADEVID